MPIRLILRVLPTLLLLVAGCLLVAAVTNAAVATYTYDELDRLTRVDYDDGTAIVYTYDEIGNRLQTYTLPTYASPKADFTASPINGNNPLTVNFTDTTTGNATTWQWNFGDGSPANNQQNPVHIYGSAGTYTVTLSVSNPLGSNSVTKANCITVQASSYTITTAAVTGGTVTPASAKVSPGGSQTFTITPGIRYTIADVKVDGVSKGAITSYTFANVTTGHTLEASFALAACSNLPVRIVGGSTYSTLQAAYNVAVEGDVIQSQAQAIVDNYTADRPISVTIDGGYACDYSANPEKTILKGMPSIKSGTVTMKNLLISN
jgi:PKD repeat protein